MNPDREPSSPLSLLGVCGYSRTGKDTAAAALVEQGWLLSSFGDPVKRIAYGADPVVHGGYSLRHIVDVLGWERVKDHHSDVVPFLQKLGQAIRDEFGQQPVIDAALACAGGGRRIVNPSVRFPQEADAIRERGGVVVRIDRPGVGPLNDHPMEVAMDGYDVDHTIVNDGSVERLQTLMRGIVAAWS